MSIEHTEVWLREVEDTLSEPLWVLPRGTCDTDYLRHLDVADDGSIYAAGVNLVARECLDDDPCAHFEWLRRLDPGYADVWARSFAYDEFRLREIKATADGGVVAVGTAIQDGAGSPWIAHYDLDGALLWEEVAPEEGHALGVAIGPSGEIVVVGAVASADTEDLWVAKRSASGDAIWTASFASEEFTAGVRVAVGSTGAIWVAGGHGDGMVVPSYCLESLEFNSYDACQKYDFDASIVAYLDPNGTLVWSDVAHASFDASAQTIALLPGGDAVVGGQRSSDLDWLARYDASGARIWERDLGIGRIVDVAAASDGTIFALDGETRTIAQVDGDGELLWGPESLVPEGIRDAFALTTSDRLLITGFDGVGVYHPPYGEPYPK
jgi:hypothetical protein